MVGMPEPSVDMGMLIVHPSTHLDYDLMVGMPEPSVDMGMLIVHPSTHLDQVASLWSHGGHA